MGVEREFRNPTVVQVIESLTEKELAQLLGVSQVLETLSEDEKLRQEALNYYKNAPGYPLVILIKK